LVAKLIWLQLSYDHARSVKISIECAKCQLILQSVTASYQFALVVSAYS